MTDHHCGRPLPEARLSLPGATTKNRIVRLGTALLAGMAFLALTLIGPPVPDALAATLTVPTLIGNHMVLQRGMPDPIWGRAPAGATVTVRFNRHTVSTTAAANGRWRLNLASMPATSSPGRLTITSGREKLTFKDVQVGEVWGCSGQSNMNLSLAYSSGGSAAAADAPNHDLRLFSAPETTTPDHVAWTVSDPATARAFSAVCYYFGRELAEHFGVPIGLIQSTKGGTYIEEWTHALGGACTSVLPAREEAPRPVGRLYDTKIEPLMPYAIRGFTWYQGENDSRDCAAVYFRKLQGLIGEWRAAWGEGELPFGRTPDTQEAQLQAFLTVPNTFLAVTTDLPILGGTALHPANKKPVGIRLAIGARAVAYGEPLEPVGPIPDPATSYVSGNTVVIGFTHLGGGLVTGSAWQAAGAPTPFKLAGVNGRFHAATARIVGNTVEVTSPFVPTPVQVRYTWWRDGRGNLYSAVRIPIDGGTATYTRLPAAPFAMVVGVPSHGPRPADGQASVTPGAPIVTPGRSPEPAAGHGGDQTTAGWALVAGLTAILVAISIAALTLRHRRA